LAAVLAAIGWMRTAHIERADVLWAIAGAAAAIAVTLAVRGLVGPRLPAFIPPEESSAPGMALGLSAGLVEEIVFRLLILPAVYLLGRRKLLAAILAVVVSGALFSLSHELGPAGGVFDRRFMITRFVIPGAGMSLVALVRPSFMVTAHCTAHLTIPLLFR
jgi:membrane protease YdiL (CAAX protease family)